MRDAACRMTLTIPFGSIPVATPPRSQDTALQDTRARALAVCGFPAPIDAVEDDRLVRAGARQGGIPAGARLDGHAPARNGPTAVLLAISKIHPVFSAIPVSQRW